MPYAFYDYLDIATGRHWEALITPDYEYIFPLPYEKKLGLKFYTQPLLSQQLGLIGTNPSPQMISDFLNQIPENHSGVSLKLNESNKVFSVVYHPRQRTNYTLELIPTYESLVINFSKSLRKRIREGSKVYQLEVIQEIQTVVDYYRTEMEGRLKLGPMKYELIFQLLNWLKQQELGKIYAAKKADGSFGAMLFVATTKYRLINLFGASNPEGRSNYAMHFIINEVIKKYAGQKRIFDFEGSDIPGVAQFYQSFGSINRPYLELDKKQAPSWYKLLVRLKRMVGSS